MKRSAGEGSVESPQPVTVGSAERTKVSIDDRYQIVTWIRQTAPVTYESNEDWSFGKSEARYATVPLRMVFAHKSSLGENLVYDFVQNIPSKLTAPDYQFIFIGANQAIDTDHEAVYETELGKTVYEKHRFKWNVYAITLNVQFIICEGDYRLTEDGSYRVLE
jgi:hypothetical protein